MSFFQDEQKLVKHFLDAWDNVSDWNGIPVDTSAMKKSPDGEGRIIRFRVKRAPSSPFSIGSSRRNRGSAIVQIVMKQGDGQGEVMKVADKIADVFAPGHKPIRIGALRCKLPSASGPHEDGSFVTASVDIPWHSDYST